MADGTVMEVSPIVAEVRKVGKHHDGKPMYACDITTIFNVISTDEQSRQGLQMSGDAAV